MNKIQHNQAESFYNLIGKLSLVRLVKLWVQLDMELNRRIWVGITAVVTITIGLVIALASEGDFKTFALGSLATLLVIILFYLVSLLSKR
jgi:hypothetical protein